MAAGGGLTGRGVKRVSRSQVGDRPVLRRGDRIAWYEVRVSQENKKEAEKIMVGPIWWWLS